MVNAGFVDTCMVNASTEFALNQNQDPKSQKAVFKFVLELRTTLITLQITKRSVVGLQIPIIRKLEAVLGYKLQKESNCPTSCRQYPSTPDTKKNMSLLLHIFSGTLAEKKKLACLCPRPNAKHVTNQFVPFTLHVSAHNVYPNNPLSSK